MPILRRAFLASAAALTPAFAAGAAPTGLREQLLGAWSLRYAEDVSVADGTTGPWSRRPRPYTGMLIYSPSGKMSLQIASRRPAPAATKDLSSMEPHERLVYLDSFHSAFGRFQVDEPRARVRHLLDSALDPGKTGRTDSHAIILKGDVLTLTTDDMARAKGEDRFTRMTWVRA